MGFHAAIATFVQHPVYDQWPAFGRMLGGTENGGHPWVPTDTYTFKVDDPKSPLNAVFQGQGIRGHRRGEPVAGAHPARPPARAAERRYGEDRDAQALHAAGARQGQGLSAELDPHEGKGRVFYYGLAHGPTIFWNPRMLEHFLAGIQYALGDLKADATPSAAAGKK